MAWKGKSLIRPDTTMGDMYSPKTARGRIRISGVYGSPWGEIGGRGLELNRQQQGPEGQKG